VIGFLVIVILFLFIKNILIKNMFLNKNGSLTIFAKRKISEFILILGNS